MLRVYLDNCSFNRPFDDQTQVRINLETEAKLAIQAKICAGALELAWSYILDYENTANPFRDRRAAVAVWKKLAGVYVEETPALLLSAERLQRDRRIAPKDALHVACAMMASCDCLLTTDDILVKKLLTLRGLRVCNPVAWFLP